jgi:hypothetical protein
LEAEKKLGLGGLLHYLKARGRWDDLQNSDSQSSSQASQEPI